MSLVPLVLISMFCKLNRTIVNPLKFCNRRPGQTRYNPKLFRLLQQTIQLILTSPLCQLRWLIVFNMDIINN